jgi:hypothetical protein
VERTFSVRGCFGAMLKCIESQMKACWGSDGFGVRLSERRDLSRVEHDRFQDELIW